MHHHIVACIIIIKALQVLALLLSTNLLCLLACFFLWT